MFKHQHPYSPYIPEGAIKLIVGTLPPPRFSMGKLRPDDVDFCYGSSDGQLWKILSRIFEIELQFENTQFAIQQRKELLNTYKIGVCDMIELAYRKKIDASDVGIQNPEFRPILSVLKKHQNIRLLLFTGGNSKNGPEYFFRKYLKDFPEIKLTNVSATVPKIHQFHFENRIIQTVSLTAPSGSANRAVGSMEEYKKRKKENPSFDTIDFRVLQYRPFFKEPKVAIFSAANHKV